MSNTSSHANYIGRFAPSPTGSLHIGSLIGALASYLDAKAHQGQWLLRMEDLDPPREIAGAAINILNSLETHGLNWDGEVLWQSQQHHHYQAISDHLIQNNKAFYCSCSRSDLAQLGGVHKGRCQIKPHEPPTKSPSAVRLLVDNSTVQFNDGIQGTIKQQLNEEVGDFVIQRKDQLFAYQLAVVADDAQQGINHIVRGSDLLDSTARQIYLQRVLGYPTPQYSHFPVITNSEGQKLSKQTFAPALDNQQPQVNLLKALRFLNQPIPPQQQQRDCHSILNWAVQHWRTDHINKTLTIAE